MEEPREGGKDLVERQHSTTESNLRHTLYGQRGPSVNLYLSLVCVRNGLVPLQRNRTSRAGTVHF